MPASARCSFEDDKLLENARALADAIQKAKPTGAKGTYVQKGGAQLDHGAGRPGGCRQLGSELVVDRLLSNGGEGPIAEYACPDRQAGRGREFPNLSETARPLGSSEGLMDPGSARGRREVRILGSEPEDWRWFRLSGQANRATRPWRGPNASPGPRA